MLALSHEPAWIEAPDRTPSRTVAAVEQLAAPSLSQLSLQAVLARLNLDNALQTWFFGCQLKQPMRGIIFAAVIGLAAPVIHQVESLPGWSLLSEGCRMTLITVGSAVRLFVSAQKTKNLGQGGGAVSEFLALVRDARCELHERLKEAELRQVEEDAKIAMEEQSTVVPAGWFRLAGLHSVPSTSRVRAAEHAHQRLENGRCRLRAIDRFIDQVKEARRSSHAWQLEQAFTMIAGMPGVVVSSFMKES